MRRGEALGLDRGDLDPAAGVLTSVRRSSTSPDNCRCIPPPWPRSSPTQRAGTGCVRVRARGALFVSTTGARLAATTVSQTFRALLRETGIGATRPACRPHIHDARHTFAVNTLLGWYRDGVDVQARLPLLSTYLGHTDPSAHLLVSVGRAGTARPGRRPAAAPRRTATVMTALAPTLQAFFTERLARQKQASPHTVAAYRDTLRLLLGFAAEPHRQGAGPDCRSMTSTPR